MSDEGQFVPCPTCGAVLEMNPKVYISFDKFGEITYCALQEDGITVTCEDHEHEFDIEDVLPPKAVAQLLLELVYLGRRVDDSFWTVNA